MRSFLFLAIPGVLLVLLRYLFEEGEVGRSSLEPPRLSFVSLFWLAWHPAAEPSRLTMNALPRQSRGKIWLRGVGVCGLVLLYALGSDDARGS